MDAQRNRKHTNAYHPSWIPYEDIRADESSLLLLSRGTADVRNDFLFVISSCMNKIILFPVTIDKGYNTHASPIPHFISIKDFKACICPALYSTSELE
ncbi:hypothetical protein B5X24_HaOG202979 [Helicoverpa armigera]|uniref:Uncharacterized protein n=1 Tax=Helicoverpa armigera TaxID=29058 RepID=A0A2W1BRT4_HELAM|nr:hypothetical protein B5X24_HaOG202979 [Helicoverpa armigera]